MSSMHQGCAACRSPSPPPRPAEAAAPVADRKTGDDSEKLRTDLVRVRSERSQAQQESAQLQMQLQELADKANSKLYDYRLKLKGAKKRSQLRCGPQRRQVLQECAAAVDRDQDHAGAST